MIDTPFPCDIGFLVKANKLKASPNFDQASGVSEAKAGKNESFRASHLAIIYRQVMLAFMFLIEGR